MIPLVQNLLNSGSKDMTVDGSGTPVSFTYSPGSGTVLLHSITCILQDSGTSTLDKFGTLNALSNGLQIQVTIGGVTTTICNMVDNADIITKFQFSHFGNGATDTLGAIIGFCSSSDIFVGTLYIPETHHVLLSGSDTLTVKVRDNLSNIDFLQMSCMVISE